jgi:hypothetical protein
VKRLTHSVERCNFLGGFSFKDKRRHELGDVIFLLERAVKLYPVSFFMISATKRRSAFSTFASAPGRQCH